MYDIPGCSGKRRRKNQNGNWLALLRYAAMWTRSREMKPDRESEIKRGGNHVFTHVLLLLEKSAEMRGLFFLDR